ncbi:MAG TPA: hypothetical protein ENN51_08685 [candidate division WOR-3 bacterium]|uniref:EamA domain-containing protein n=1 Tax=candidate division WOR-3 bacterium TaxID=2052148 RepID=A0A7V0XFZ6_UNCW3|nr:hypothetical protein [candidate division WOR-3 bacterium]
MHFLLLKVAAAVGLGLVLRRAEGRGRPVLPMLRVNYAVAAVLAFFGAHLAGQQTISLATALLGAATGVVFVAGLLVWARAIRAAGLALSVVAMRTAIVVPVLLAAFIWHERPVPLELAGSAVALCALGLVLSDAGRGAAGPGRKRRAALWLAALFAVDGLVVTAALVFRKQLPPEETLPFQAVVFVSAFLVTTALYYLRRERLDREALSWGSLLGLANLGNYLFLVLALSVLPGIVVYPVIAAGEVGLLALAGAFIWRERPGLRSWVGIGLTVAALVLLQFARAANT